MTGIDEAAAAVLERAAERIEHPGAWCQDLYCRRSEGHPTAYCALAAVEAEAGRAADGPFDAVDISNAAVTALARAIDSYVPPEVGMLGVVLGWHDTDGRTAREVAWMMRRAAREMRDAAQRSRAD